MIEIREREIELKLRKATADRGGLCLKFTPSNWAGAPDRLVVLPGGAMGFVEVKAPGQKARPLQGARHRRLTELGCYVAVLDDPTKVNAVLDEIEQHTPDTIRRSQTATTEGSNRAATEGSNKAATEGSNRAATEGSNKAATERSHSRMNALKGGDEHAKPG